MLNREQEPGRILIIQDKGKPGTRVAAALQKLAETLSTEIVTASGQSDLRQMLKTLALSAVVIDVGREIGDTLAALRILAGFSAIPLFIFNSFTLPRIEEKARGYDHIRYFENDLDLDGFISLVLAAVQKKKPGTIQGISLSGFLQLLNSEKWSGQVTVMAQGGKGLLLIRDGRLVDASCGELKGDAAWLEMAAWEEISVETQAKRIPGAFRDGRGKTTALAPMPSPDSRPKVETGRAVAGHIEFLHIRRPDRRISLNLKRINQALAGIRDILAASLLRTDIFLAEDGRSLAGWNSHPLACSQFAAITKSLKESLQACHFPPLRDYYLLDLEADQLLFIVITDDLQWGFLLQGTKERLGLLFNIVLPRAMAALTESLAVEPATLE
jgi:hypothetical protein